MSQSVNEVTETYQFDLNGGLTQVLSDGTNTYLYGLGRVSQESGDEVGLFLPDGLGSVRTVVTGEKVSLARDYAPYGEELARSGAMTSEYGNAGEWTDRSGMQYLRARYYDPSMGRFISRDGWLGKQIMPLSYNKWLYGYANPIMNPDPTGLQPCRNGSRYCLLSGKWNGAFIDVDHWWAAIDITQDIDEKLSAVKGIEGALIALKHRVSIITVSGEYSTNLPTQVDENIFNGVVLGIFMAFENQIETTESFHPSCFFPSGRYQDNECSGFANEDLPSDYLGYLTRINRWERNIEEIVEKVFNVEGEASDTRPIDPKTDPMCIYFGQCDDNTPYNRCWDFKILSENGKYIHKSFPAEYLVEPAKRGEYWDVLLAEPAPGFGFQ